LPSSLANLTIGSIKSIRLTKPFKPSKKYKPLLHPSNYCKFGKYGQPICLGYSPILTCEIPLPVDETKSKKHDAPELTRTLQQKIKNEGLNGVKVGTHCVNVNGQPLAILLALDASASLPEHGKERVNKLATKECAKFLLEATE
jgi:hypothetical protein